MLLDLVVKSKKLGKRNLVICLLTPFPKSSSLVPRGTLHYVLKV